MAPDPSGTFRYDNEIDLCIESAHTKVLALVGQRRRVLELGCSTGQMTRVMHERGCTVVAIEADAEVAKLAAEYCEHMVVGDLEQLDFDVELGERRFDVIVAADVLEHLKDPEAVLAALRPFLAPGGYLVASVPNVTHGSVRLALLGGSFPYADTGLLDRTHLRFYNRESLSEMLTRGEFSAVHVETVDLQIHRSEVPFNLGPEAQAFVDALERQPDALTYQFIVVAFPARPPLGPIPRLLLDLNTRVQELDFRLYGLELSHAGETEGLRAELAGSRAETATLFAEMEHMTAVIKEKDAAFEALTQRSAAEAGELRAELDRSETALRAIYASKLWRVAQAYRFVVRMAKRL